MAEVRIEGLDKTVRALRRLPKELSGKGGGPVRSALFQSAKLMREDAKQRAPRDSGNLAESIILYRDRNPRSRNNANERYFVTVRRGKRLSQTLGFRSAGRTRGAYYAHFVEFGTIKWSGHPFMRPAFESKKRESVRVFGDVLGKRVAAAAKKAAQG